MSKSYIEVKIPERIRHLAGPIQCFFEAMVYKLDLNAHKGRWEDIGVQRAMDLLEGEKAELQDAIHRGNAIEMLLEGADVANFALILSNIAVNGLNSDHISKRHPVDESLPEPQVVYTGNRGLPSPEQAAESLRSSRAQAARSGEVVNSPADKEPLGS